MTTRKLSRRRFLAGTTAATAMAATALSTRRSHGANERISVGVIGAGGRGSYLMDEIHKNAESHDVEITAVCDVWKVNREAAAGRVKEWFGNEPRAFSRFGDLIALEDVDAVTIATPDYAHTPIMIAALEAGKDVYVEKPMALEIENANRAFDLARKNERVVQCGTQYRSSGGYWAAAKAIGEGVLGPVNRITAAANFNEPRWRRGYSNCKEEDVDWEAFLFNRPKRPFDPKLLRRWHFYKDFTNGLSGLWMSHYVDAVHIITGAKYPSAASALGGVYIWKDGREHCDTFHALLEYPEGFLFDWGMSLGNSANNFFTVHGPRGTLEISRNYNVPDSLLLSGEGGAGPDKIQESRRLKPERGESHMGNWLDCMRTRERPNADIEYGHQHAVGTIMAAAALHEGRRMKYDPEKRGMSAL